MINSHTSIWFYRTDESLAMTHKYAFFEETLLEIEFYTFWQYALKSEVKFWKRVWREMATGDCHLNSFFAITQWLDVKVSRNTLAKSIPLVLQNQMELLRVL